MTLLTVRFINKYPIFSSMVYEPAEDSYLIQEEVKKLARGRVLDMGTGSGILAETAAKSKKVKSVIGADIQKKTVDHCRKTIKNRKVKFVKSDLFSNIPKKNRFDTIIFNPPYLPEQKGETWELSTEVAGGKHGYEITERFLKDANSYLEPNGIMILLFSSITGKMKIDQLIAGLLMDAEEISRKNLAFEQLFVYRIKKSAFRKALEKRGVTKILPLTKGHRGLIHIGRWKNRKITIKSQRRDIDAKETVDNEVKQLRLLNRKGIGPKVIFSGKDYFAYSYIEGHFIKKWLERKETKKKDALIVIRRVFDQMFTMDQMGLNKEEMHHPLKHIIVQKNNRPVLLDFERCRPRDKVHNVTQFAQFMISGRMIPVLDRLKIRINLLEMLNRARKYSENKSIERFEDILDLVKS